LRLHLGNAVSSLRADGFITAAGRNPALHQPCRARFVAVEIANPMFGPYAVAAILEVMCAAGVQPGDCRKNGVGDYVKGR
jgi:hypothetical protein